MNVRKLLIAVLKLLLLWLRACPHGLDRCVYQVAVLSLACGVSLAAVFAVFEVAFSSTCICTNMLCELLRRPIIWLAPIHGLIGIPVMLTVMLPAIIYRVRTGKTSAKLVIGGLFTASALFFLEDLLWHVIAWMVNVQPPLTFCKWAREPFEQLPIPWWYIFGVASWYLVYRWIRWLRKCAEKCEEERSAREDLKRKVAVLLLQSSETAT